MSSYSTRTLTFYFDLLNYFNIKFFTISRKFKKIKYLFYREFIKEPFLGFGIVFLVFSAFVSFGFTIIGLKITPDNQELDISKRIFYQSYRPQMFLSYQEGYFEDPGVVITQRNSLVANSGLVVKPRILGSLVEVIDQPSRERKEIVEYKVQKGETLLSIARKFNLSLNTILWANNLSKNSILKPGQKLVILPVDGVIHHVQKGDTLSALAKLYRVNIEEIINYNSLEDEKIYIGDVLIIPHAKKPAIQYSTQILKPLPSSYFICPITPPCRRTQGLHWYNAVDLSHGRCGDPVLASAGGIVQKTGYSRIAGNYVRILHPNRTVTFYAHLSKSIVSSGQQVFQGQIIGYIGHSGYTIPAGPAGCHLHFEVRGAVNPFAY